jgi:hypothetical protein
MPPRRRYDVLITAASRYALAPGAVRTLIQRIAFTGVASPNAEAIARTWAEVYMQPATLAKSAFVIGGDFQTTEPIFLDAAMCWFDTPQAITYGDVTKNLNFYLEFRGCLFQAPHGEFRKEISGILNTRLEVLSRPHVSLPPHREVAPDEVPDEVKPKRSDRSAGLVGIATHEF